MYVIKDNDDYKSTKIWLKRFIKTVRNTRKRYSDDKNKLAILGGGHNTNKRIYSTIKNIQEKTKDRNTVIMNNIVSLSGGKDSTAMLLMILEKKIKVDHIVFFDTGWEFPQMIEHIDKLEKYIGREIIRLKHKIPFDELIKKYGFANFKVRWCTDRKVKAISKYCKNNIPYTQYIGFSYDERQRIKKTISYCYPLVDWKVTEEDALEYCHKKGFDWGGLYDKYKRVSCWNCPLQGLKDLKVLWKNFPDYWKKLLKMQKQSKWQFRMDYTLEELDEKFRREESYYQLELN